MAYTLWADTSARVSDGLNHHPGIAFPQQKMPGGFVWTLLVESQVGFANGSIFDRISFASAFL
jgi:hypothetical protein